MLRAGPNGIDQSFLLQMRRVLVQNVSRYMTVLSAKEASASAPKGYGKNVIEHVWALRRPKSLQGQQLPNNYNYYKFASFQLSPAYSQLFGM